MAETLDVTSMIPNAFEPKKANRFLLAIEGIDDPLRAESIAGELEELPLPYRFDVQVRTAIKSPALLAHIERVGVRIYGKHAR